MIVTFRAKRNLHFIRNLKYIVALMDLFDDNICVKVKLEFILEEGWGR